MQGSNDRAINRRRLLGLLAAGSLAGCLGSGSDSEDSTAEDTETGGMPTDDGTANSGTSPADSCAAAFGDTDQRYDPGNRGLVATFSYPMGGRIYEESSEAIEYLTAIGYGANEHDEYRHRLRVYQRGPVDYDVAGTYTGESDWTDGDPVTYDGTERAVAVLQSETTAQRLFGIEGPDGTYEIQVQVGANIGDSCPDVYGGVCIRVANSFEPLSQ